MSQGALPQSSKQSRKRFADKLSFSKLYMNQFQVFKLQSQIEDINNGKSMGLQEKLDELKNVDN